MCYEYAKGVWHVMVKERGMQVENIGVILAQVLEQRQSGALRATYVRDGRRETGEIYLLAGQLIYARVGTLTGQEALRYLLNWRNVEFAFATGVPRPPANISSKFNVNSVLTPAHFFMAKASGMSGSPQTVPGMQMSGFSVMPERAPQKTGSGQVDLLPSLTRPQRHIYMLVDGKRTIPDLVRTTGKSQQEVEAILRELRQRDLIDHQ
jgi:hypothetical protein